MSYIEREKALKVVADIMSDCKVSHKHRALNRNIKQITTADVVEVVRCKDCIYNSNGSCTHSEIYDDPNYNPDYYCADGERREE